jgi:hypothetical protein
MGNLISNQGNKKKRNYNDISHDSHPKDLDGLDVGEYLVSRQYSQEFVDQVKDLVLKNNDGDAKFKNAMIENYKIIEQSSRYVAKRFWSSSPCLDLRLDPSEVYTVYKVACFKDNENKFIDDVAVLVTLYIQSSKAFVADGATGNKIVPEQMLTNTKYCTKTAIVVGVQFFGNIISVEKVLNIYKEGNGQVVSNFDSKFAYTLGHEINEPKFGQPGNKCVQGIHFFIDKRSALKYSLTGFLDTENMLTPVISKSFTESRLQDDIKEAGLQMKQMTLYDPHVHANNLTDAEIEKLRVTIENLYSTTKTTNIINNRWNNNTIQISA